MLCEGNAPGETSELECTSSDPYYLRLAPKAGGLSAVAASPRYECHSTGGSFSHVASQISQCFPRGGAVIDFVLRMFVHYGGVTLNITVK